MSQTTKDGFSYFMIFKACLVVCVFLPTVFMDDGPSTQAKGWRKILSELIRKGMVRPNGLVILGHKAK